MATINVYSDSIQTQVGTEVTVFELSNDIAPYAIVEGYIDLSGMPSDAVVEVREYIGIGSTPVLFLSTLVDSSLNGRMLRIHSKAVPNGGSYKVTVTQQQGGTITINYWFAQTGLT